MVTSIAITPEEHRARCDALLERLRSEELSGVVLFDPYYVLYYAGFAFAPTERPIAFVLAADGTRALVVPRLEVEHAEAKAMFDRVEHYLEYPGDPRSEDALETTLSALGLTGKIGADQDGYPWILGYRGPTLSELSGATVVRVAAQIEEQMAIKSEAEVALIRESCAGGTSRTGSSSATRARASPRPRSRSAHRTRPPSRCSTPSARSTALRASSRAARTRGTAGQIGRNSAIPHALAGNIVFQEGDVLVTGASAPVWGYLSELERTMVIGEPTPEQERHVRAHEGRAGGRVRGDQAGRDAAPRSTWRCGAYFAQHDLFAYWRHHTGHAIGLRYHEGPFLDSGDHTEIRPGMVFTVEPGLYAPELGGFRHSDTVLVTEDGIEILTYYPRDLASLIIPRLAAVRLVEKRTRAEVRR